MKKMLGILLAVVFLVVSVPSLAEETTAESSYLTVENCEDLASAVDPINSNGERLENFAVMNAGKTIEIDGFVYRTQEQLLGKYDITVSVGDHSDRTDYVFRPLFHFRDVTAEELGFEGNGLPDFIEYGKDVRIVGVISGLDRSLTGGIILNPISIEARNPLTESLDTSAYTETFEKGSKGDDVKALQQRLIDLYYLDDTADGIYGNKTKAAVEKFQNACDLEVTGVADPVTQAILYSDDAPEATLSVSCASMVVGSSGKTTWYVDGQSFTLTGSQTKTIKTVWGTYKFDALGNYEKID